MLLLAKRTATTPRSLDQVNLCSLQHRFDRVGNELANIKLQGRVLTSGSSTKRSPKPKARLLAKPSCEIPGKVPKLVEGVVGRNHLFHCLCIVADYAGDMQPSEAHEFQADYEQGFDDMQPSEDGDGFEENQRFDESPFVGRHPSSPERPGQPTMTMRPPATPVSSGIGLFPVTPRPKAAALVGSKTGFCETGQPHDTATGSVKKQPPQVLSLCPTYSSLYLFIS